MAIKTILFDLDGTLLPMDQELFVKYYLGGLAKKLIPHGYDKDKFLSAMWAGVNAMIKNDSGKRNDEIFWEAFCSIMGEHVREDEPLFDEFYRNEFQTISRVCGKNPQAAEIISKLKTAGYQILLATNPLFPPIATESRIRWAGLTPEDFEFYTTYDNSYHCKPNPKYYQDILERLDLDPSECLMVGNDVEEDMVAGTLGMQVFLLTDCLINRNDKDINNYVHGNFEALVQYLDSLK